MREVSEASFQKFCVLYAHHFDLSRAETYDALPEKLRLHLKELPYRTIVKPLVCQDRCSGLSWEFLSRRYSLPIRTIRDLAGCCS